MDESLHDIVRTRPRRAALEALRDRLAADIDDIPGPSPLVPALSKQLTEVMREIENLTEPEGSALDDLAARRARRLADS
jgi:hypothetical protein